MGCQDGSVTMTQVFGEIARLKMLELNGRHGLWMLFTALDHYRFTMDTGFARNIALPLLKSAFQFYDAFSVFQDGYYATFPSNSP